MKHQDFYCNFSPLYYFWYMGEKRLTAIFYKTSSGNVPVLEWLRELGKADSLIIGSDLRLVEEGWPIGMPVCRSLGDGLFETRSNLPNGRTARIIFFIKDGKMGILHGFIKKTQQTPQADIELAKKRKKEMENATE